MHGKLAELCAIGADPGRFGALCWLETAENGQTVRLLRQMPDDPDELAYLLAPHAHLSLALEQQMPMPRQGVASAGKLMHRAGVVRGICAGLGLRMVPVWPVQIARHAGRPDIRVVSLDGVPIREAGNEPHDLVWRSHLSVPPAGRVE
jgi:hypothetical protein